MFGACELGHMTSSGKILGRIVTARFAVVGLLAAGVAGCSADVTRFSEAGGGPQASLPRQGSPEVTGSLGAAPSARVDSAPIGAPVGSAQTAYAPANTYGNSGGQPLYGSSAYNTPPVAPAAQAAPAAHTAAAAAPRTPAPGPQPLGTLSSTQPAPARASQPVAAAPLATPAPAPVAAAPAAPKTQQVAAATPVVTPATPAVPAKTAAVTPAATSAPAAAKVDAATKDDVDEARSPGSGPQFRAPVRGRVISGFGPKPGGTRNDGVNFAVPEGTAVRAAEDGTVAYAGNELKGYGNLVLIKHADGFVTAYAHNSEISVKRGDTVRRGQIIAKAGQSGGVTTPQLHFEIRKGSQPVDPSQYVAGL